MVPQTTSSRTSARGCVIRRTSRGSSIVAKCSSRTASRDLSDSAAAADDMRGLRIEEPHGINPECACHPLSHEFGALGSGKARLLSFDRLDTEFRTWPLYLVLGLLDSACWQCSPLRRLCVVVCPTRRFGQHPVSAQMRAVGLDPLRFIRSMSIRRQNIFLASWSSTTRV